MQECPTNPGQCCEKGTLPLAQREAEQSRCERPPQWQSPLQTQHLAPHHHAFQAVTHSSSQQEYETINLDGGTPQSSSLPEGKVKVNSTTASLQYLCFTSPPTFWGAAEPWAQSQPQHRAGSGWSQMGDGHLTSSTPASLPVPTMGSITLPSLQRLQQPLHPPPCSQQCSRPQLWSTWEVWEWHQVLFGWRCCYCCFKIRRHVKIIIKRQYSC